MSTQQYHKLVRDRIPEIISAQGNACTTEILSDDDYLTMLYACAEARGYTKDQLEKMRIEKAASRGGFAKKILLKEVIKP